MKQPRQHKVRRLIADSSGTAARPMRTPRSAASRASETTPSRDLIAARAYSYWEARGCQGGSAEEDWYRAIHELASERARAL